MASECVHHDVARFDGTDFAYWKMLCYQVLVQEKQVKPIKCKGVKPTDMTQDAWLRVDSLTMSTIRSLVTHDVYMRIMHERTSHGMWESLCDM